MKSQETNQCPKVYRITIDEKLGQDHIRILVATLKADKLTFKDDPDYWSEEEISHIYPDDYGDLLRLSGVNFREWIWEKLKEGQVFLAGEFEPPQSFEDETFIKVKSGLNSFMRIDPFIKGWIKQKYLLALQRESQHATNQVG